MFPATIETQTKLLCYEQGRINQHPNSLNGGPHSEGPLILKFYSFVTKCFDCFDVMPENDHLFQDWSTFPGKQGQSCDFPGRFLAESGRNGSD